MPGTKAPSCPWSPPSIRLRVLKESPAVLKEFRYIEKELGKPAAIAYASMCGCPTQGAMPGRFVETLNRKNAKGKRMLKNPFQIGDKVVRTRPKLINGANEVGEVVEIDTDRCRILWAGSPNPQRHSEMPKRTWLGVRNIKPA